MSLSKATLTNGRRLFEGSTGPIPCDELRPYMGTPFQLPCEDPWLLEEGTLGHQYLENAKAGWEENPEWMDFLDLGSPCYTLKSLERDLTLSFWSPWLGPVKVLDVGCGIGRFTQPFLDRGATVYGVDGDLRSLHRCLWHAAGRSGELDLSWSTVHSLPDVEGFDVVIASEVLCYVPEYEEILPKLYAKLRPGGALLISMEARWGWATAADAPLDAIDEALAGTGVLAIADRWVRTVTQEELTEALTGAGFTVERMIPTHYLGDGPLENVSPSSLSLERLLAIEERARTHRIWGPLNRLWTAVALRPSD